MSNCHYCKKECDMEAFIPETGMTIDFPICNDICLKKLRIERGYDQPKEYWEIDFKIGLIDIENKHLEEKISNNRIKIKELLKNIHFAKDKLNEQVGK